MALEIFNRHENKYIVQAEMLQELELRLSLYMDLDAHNREKGCYSLASLYYDTVDRSLVRQALSRPAYKEKLRIRSYGKPEPDDMVFLEIKKKVKGMTNKRRSTLFLEEAYDFANGHIKPVPRAGMNLQVVEEIDQLLHRYELFPSMYISYQRRAWMGNSDVDLRISFDTDIRYRTDDLRLESGMYGQKLLDDAVWIMEIKAKQAMPLWLVRMLSDYRLYPIKFSKYGKAYGRESINDRKKNYPLQVNSNRNLTLISA